MEELLWIVGIVVMFLFMGECIGEYIYSRGKTTFQEANFHPFETVLYKTKNDFDRTILGCWNDRRSTVRCKHIP